MLLRYAALTKHNLHSLKFVFFYVLPPFRQGLSCTRAREVVSAKFCAIAVDTSRIGLHWVLQLHLTAAFLMTSLKTMAGGNLTLPRNYIAGKVSDDSFLLLRA